jgi:hypothetical protein
VQRAFANEAVALQQRGQDTLAAVSREHAIRRNAIRNELGVTIGIKNNNLS